MNLNKPQKILLAICLSILLLLSAIFYLVHSLDAAKVMQVAAGQVKSATGRDFQVKGPVSVSFFPRLSVTAEQVTLSNPDWATDPQMLSAGRVAFSLRWAPLFHQQIEIDDVSLDQVLLILQASPIASKGSGNWVFDNAVAKPNTNATEPLSDSGFGFDLSALHLNQVSVVYKNTLGSVVESLQIKRLDIKAPGNQVQIDGVLNWNALPLTVKGQTDSWETLINNWSVKPTNFSVDLNLGINKQSARVLGIIQFAPNKTPVLDLALQSDLLDLKPWVSNATGEVQSAQSATNSKSKVFSSEALGFNGLPIWQGKIVTTISALTLPSGLKLKDLNATVTTSANDGLVLSPVSFTLGAGRIVADAQLNDVHGTLPTLKIRGYATGLSFEHVMAQLGEGGLVTGGPTQAAFNVMSRGGSVSALAANANGALQFSVGPATVNNSIVKLGGDFLLTLANTINPLRKSSDASQLTCLVAYLPVHSGLVSINQSVGMRTQALDLSLNGQINLGSETLNINFQPKDRSGLTTGVNPAGLVQVVGTLANPRMGINKTGVVKQAAGVGLAIVTGGISLVAQNAAGVVTRASPCDNVLRPWSQVSGGLDLSH